MARQTLVPRAKIVAAREAIGLTPEEAARRARVTSAYLHRIERNGGASYVLACRLSRLYNAPIDIFLKRGTKAKRRTAATAPHTESVPTGGRHTASH